jgi:dGTPase
MEWNRLACADRLRRPDAAADDGRSPFQKDIDRITFSASFRRLANKTQVHLFSPNDHVHTRLTHSIEVASVGRSLGTLVGKKIAASTTGISADEIGCIVQAACLAHDIGNPPFGHAGEQAIRSWFTDAHSKSVTSPNKTYEERFEDFQHFQGNAQGFRLLTQLENNKQDGGLQLTYPVLGSFVKYPRASNVTVGPKDDWPWATKIGFFKPEENYFAEAAKALGLVRRNAQGAHWCRHPLAFLVEAADDICYSIIDIEDGYELRDLSFDEAKAVLTAIAPDTSLSRSMGKPEQIAKLRAVAINNLVHECAHVFLDNEMEILNATFLHEIIQISKYKQAIQAAKDLALEKLCHSDRNTKLKIAGTAIIEGLLRNFCRCSC